MLTQVVFLLLGIGIGLVVGFLYFRNTGASNELVQNEKVKAAELLADNLRRETQTAKEDTALERSKSEGLQIKLAKTEQENLSLKQQMERQMKELDELQQRFQKEFENLANKILDEKSKKFTEQNENQLKGILDPLKERIQNFEKRVNETHNESEKERSALKEQLRNMADMTKRMSEDALNLTKALKGDSKKQGNWGELILEKVLEKSGLVKGREYDVQQSFTNEDGSRLQPDVIIRLPDAKNLIVDSKVSLVAYERYMSSEEDEKTIQEGYLKEHINSIRAHIKGLSGKSYQNLYGMGSPDFVLLFIPIESAFMLAASNDGDLYSDAFDKNVVLVSPTTLLATLRTISNVWKQEYQSQNSKEIARQGADLYDKFVAFTEDLIKVGKLMDDSKKTYSDAMGKLYEGNGNLVRRAENMKKLGLKTNKQLPQGLLDRAEE